MNSKLMVFFAHPDDESFICGGTIAKYVSKGCTVDLVCMTRGEAGERGSYDSTIDLGAMRSQELEQAADVLGIQMVKFFDYPDGKLASIEPGELEDKIHKLMLQYEPNIVITFEPNGISNHPDHKKMSIATTYAFQKYATRQVKGEKLGTRDPRRAFISQIPVKTEEPKLYYACMPEGVRRYLYEQEIIPKESFGKPWEGVPDKKVTTCIDVSDFTAKKIEALSKHKTQIADVEKFVSIDTQPLVYKEYYILRMHGEQEVFMGKSDQVAEEL